MLAHVKVLEREKSVLSWKLRCFYFRPQVSEMGEELAD